MDQKKGCCGFLCDSCAAYEGNIHSEEERQKVCQKWDFYFEYSIEPKQMHCAGCKAGAENDTPMIHGNCQYRRCAFEKGLPDCQHCAQYPCADLADYFAAYREVFEELKDEIPQEDLKGYFLTYMPQ